MYILVYGMTTVYFRAVHPADAVVDDGYGGRGGGEGSPPMWSMPPSPPLLSPRSNLLLTRLRFLTRPQLPSRV